MKLDGNNHSVFLMYYHLVLVVKYRRQVFDSEISDFAKDMFAEIGSKYTISLVEWHHDQDHIHILFKAHPNSELSKFINAYKSASSRLIKRDFPHIRSTLWKEMFWSRSFCLLTTGGAPIDTIKSTTPFHLRGKRRRSVKKEIALFLRTHAERAASSNASGQPFEYPFLKGKNSF